MVRAYSTTPAWLMLGCAALGYLVPADVHAEPSAAKSSARIEIEVGSQIPAAAELERWIDKDAHAILAERSSEIPTEGTVRVELAGTLYDYQVTIVPTLGTQTLEGSTWPCECSNEELLAELRPALALAFQQLADAEPEPPEEPEGLGLGSLGWAGIGLMSAGGVATATGVVLLAVGESRAPSPEDWGRIRVVDLRPAGGLALGAGLGAIAAGATLFWLRGRTTQPHRGALEAVTAGVDLHGRPLVTIRGRF